MLSMVWRYSDCLWSIDAETNNKTNTNIKTYALANCIIVCLCPCVISHYTSTLCYGVTGRNDELKTTTTRKHSGPFFLLSHILSGENDYTSSITVNKIRIMTPQALEIGELEWQMEPTVFIHLSKVKTGNASPV